LEGELFSPFRSHLVAGKLTDFQTSYINAEPWPTTYFTTQVINAIRKYDTNHLVLDGEPLRLSLA
jgi:hypothetical protein